MDEIKVNKENKEISKKGKDGEGEQSGPQL